MFSLKRWKSNFGQEVAADRTKLFNDLVDKLIDAEPGSPEFEATVKVAAAATEYHQFLDTDPRKVEEQVTMLKERLDTNAQFDKAQALALLQTQLLTLNLPSTQRDLTHRILCLLVGLAGRVLDTKLDSASPFLAEMQQPAPAGAPNQHHHHQQQQQRSESAEQPAAEESSSDSWEEEPPYSPGDDLSVWSDDEVQSTRKEPLTPELSHLDTFSPYHTSPMTPTPSAPPRSLEVTRPLHLTQSQSSAPKALYLPTSLPVWMAARETAGQPALVLDPRLCFTDHQLVSQALNVLKGTTHPGGAFTWDTTIAAYSVRDGVHTHSMHSTSLCSLLRYFADLGTALRRLHELCDVLQGCGEVGPAEESLTSLDPGLKYALGLELEGGSVEEQEEALQELRASPTVQAFVAALVRELHVVRQHVLALDVAHSTATTPCSGEGASSHLAADNQNTAAGRAVVSMINNTQPGNGHVLGSRLSLLSLHSQTLALRRKVLLLQEVGIYCSWRGTAAETAAGLLDGLFRVVDRHMYQATSEESGSVASMLLQIYIAALKPYLTMLHAWLYEGQLNDPGDEFFITRVHSIKEDSVEFWTLGHALRWSSTTGRSPAPAFLAPHAQTILAAGKCALALKKQHSTAASSTPAPAHDAPSLPVEDSTAGKEETLHSAFIQSLTQMLQLHCGSATISQPLLHANNNDIVVPVSARDASFNAPQGAGAQVNVHVGGLVVEGKTMSTSQRRLMNDNAISSDSTVIDMALTPAAAGRGEETEESEQYVDFNCHGALHSWMSSIACDSHGLMLSLSPEDSLGPLPQLPTSVADLEAAKDLGPQFVKLGKKSGRTTPCNEKTQGEEAARCSWEGVDAMGIDVLETPRVLLPLQGASTRTNEVSDANKNLLDVDGLATPTRRTPTPLAAAVTAAAAGGQQTASTTAPTPARPTQTTLTPTPLCRSRSMTAGGRRRSTGGPSRRSSTKGTGGASSLRRSISRVYSWTPGQGPLFDTAGWCQWFEALGESMDAPLDKPVGLLVQREGQEEHNLNQPRQPESSEEKGAVKVEAVAVAGEPTWGTASVIGVYTNTNSADVVQHRYRNLDTTRGMELKVESRCEAAPSLHVLIDGCLLQPVLQETVALGGRLCRAMLVGGLPSQLLALQDLHLMALPGLDHFVRSFLGSISTPRGIDSVMPFEVNAALQDALHLGGGGRGDGSTHSNKFNDKSASMGVFQSLLAVNAEVAPPARSVTVLDRGAGVPIVPGGGLLPVGERHLQQRGNGVSCLGRLRLTVQPKWPLSMLTHEVMLHTLGKVCTLVLQLRWVIESIQAARAAGWKVRAEHAGLNEPHRLRRRDAVMRSMLHIAQSMLEHVTLHITTAGKTLSKDLAHCSSLTAMHECLSTYEVSIKRWCLFTGDTTGKLFHEGLLRLLDDALQHCALQLPLRRAEAACLDTLQIQGAFEGTEADAKRRRLLAQLDALEVDFEERLGLLMRMVVAKGREAGGKGEVVRALLGVLDLGGYFEGSLR